MIEQMHNDYPDMNEDTRDFTRKLLFVELIENVHQNRRSGKGPKTIAKLIYNDMEEFKRVGNYEACWLYKDLKDEFAEDIKIFDKGY